MGYRPGRWAGTGWAGLGWDRLGWVGLSPGWAGSGWAGPCSWGGPNGLGWDGVGRDRVGKDWERMGMGRDGMASSHRPNVAVTAAGVGLGGDGDEAAGWSLVVAGVGRARCSLRGGVCTSIPIAHWLAASSMAAASDSQRAGPWWVWATVGGGADGGEGGRGRRAAPRRGARHRRMTSWQGEVGEAGGRSVGWRLARRVRRGVAPRRRALGDNRGHGRGRQYAWAAHACPRRFRRAVPPPGCHQVCVRTW